jgi:hypothetical protein
LAAEARAGKAAAEAISRDLDLAHRVAAWAPDVHFEAIR